MMKVRFKRSSNFKKIGFIFLSAILLVNVIFQTNFVKAATNYGSELLKTVELQDADGNPKTDFGYYESIQIHYTWEIPNSADAKAGDTMEFTLPEQLKIVTDLNFVLKDDEGNIVGNVVATKATGKVVVTFTDYVEKKSNIKGELNFWSNWDKTIINGSEHVTVEFPIDGDYVTIPVDVGPKNQINPNETLYKYGWADEKNPAIINWVVRVNYAKLSIDNAVYEDFIGPNQTLNFSSVRAYHGVFDADDNFTKGTQVPASAITQTSDGFKIAFGNLTDSVKISYYTIATDGGASSNYANKGILSGDNYVPKTIEVLTPTSGGGGSGEGTTGSVELTKTDNTAQKNPLENAEFKLINSAGTTVQEGIKTGTDGKLAISDLKFDTYKLIETKAPVGYELDASPVEFTIDETHQALFVSKENAPITGSVSLEKLDSETKAKLAGAEFELQGSDGATLQTGLTTNEEGTLTISDLALGDYQLVETKAPAGYELDASPVQFSITEETAKLGLLVTKENTKIPETPITPKNPEEPVKPEIPSKPKTPIKPDQIVSEDSTSKTLPKTGDSPLVSGLGLLLVAISASGLILFRKK
ncbi:collagen binding domain-containing protein [Listeria seeligeri]|nr:SpaA isopeptide-forming pilin-related protein [Listeria seeligeri]MBC1577929.1 collagen binding domain-containing protein [Listeria seeligeri]MBC1916536.1 collagen binding domain-containing protein [Listeria seeligeri]MBC2198844.1 collagen binding domain-containing protein [Listeria seeligeri]MBC2213416.1 collagen binding domain-containing protein [Listeria seeligeri]MBC2218221.1 collagen binding domain-containing protein [Listeria seeligeri]